MHEAKWQSCQTCCGESGSQRWLFLLLPCLWGITEEGFNFSAVNHTWCKGNLSPCPAVKGARAGCSTQGPCIFAGLCFLATNCRLSALHHPCQQKARKVSQYRSSLIYLQREAMQYYRNSVSEEKLIIHYFCFSSLQGNVFRGFSCF